MPEGSADSVARRSSPTGAYTAQVLPATEGTEPGVALVEIYDAATDDLSARLINLSARTEVAADGIVTVGFVLAGTTQRTVLLRRWGQTLAEFQSHRGIGRS